MEWDDNMAISDVARRAYWPRYASRFPASELETMMRWHALPPGWWDMDCADFLGARRPLIAHVIRDGFSLLASGMQPATASHLASVPG